MLNIMLILFNYFVSWHVKSLTKIVSFLIVKLQVKEEMLSNFQSHDKLSLTFRMFIIS